MNQKDREKIIISADDFGISNLANANILRLVREKKIDRVAVMISENLDEEDVRELKNSRVKIDIHLHLVKYDSDYWKGNRRFHEQALKRLIFFVLNYITGRRSSDKVELQWAIQIEKFRELFGKSPDGIGSHEYIHFFPPYMKAVLKLAKKYEIPYVRLGVKSTGHENIIAKILNWLRNRNYSQFKNSNFNSSDYLVSLDWVPSLSAYAESLPENTITELVCHPEREDEFCSLYELRISTSAFGGNVRNTNKENSLMEIGK